MTPQQAEKFRYNVLDLTKVWPHGEFPLRPIGKLVLDENPQNYFAEIEQVNPLALSFPLSTLSTHTRLRILTIVRFLSFPHCSLHRAHRRPRSSIPPLLLP
jgi:hypothetical protein